MKNFDIPTFENFLANVRSVNNHLRNFTYLTQLDDYFLSIGVNFKNDSDSVFDVYRIAIAKGTPDVFNPDADRIFQSFLKLTRRPEINEKKLEDWYNTETEELNKFIQYYIFKKNLDVPEPPKTEEEELIL